MVERMGRRGRGEVQGPEHPGPGKGGAVLGSGTLERERAGLGFVGAGPQMEGSSAPWLPWRATRVPDA